MSKAKTGVLWNTVERFAVQGANFIIGIILARLMAPSQFGLLAMVNIFIALSQTFVDSGFGSALIQKKDRSSIDFSTVFYFNIGVSIAIYSLIYFLAPLISDFYGQSILTPVTRIVALNLIINSFSLVQRAKLTIELNFKVQAFASLISLLLSGSLGIVMAFKGLGVWALIAQMLMSSFINTCLLWILAKWRPICVFSRESFKTLFGFGSKLLVAEIITTLYMHLYSLVIGKFYNPRDVGLYTRSSSISQYPVTNLIYIGIRVLYPLQCEHQNDLQWLKDTFPHFLRLFTYTIFPISLYFVIMAYPLVLTVLTDQWIEAAHFISILSIGYMLLPLSNLNGNLIKALGRSDITLKAEIAKKILAVLILILTIKLGLKILCWGIVVYNFLDTLVIAFFNEKLTGITLEKQIVTILPILILSSITALFTYMVIGIINNPLNQILIGTIIFGSLYYIGSKLLHLKELEYLYDFFKFRR